MRVLDYSQELIARASVTPEDGGCQEWMIAHLEEIGFAVERMSAQGVSNFWAVHGSEGPIFCFAGHTDVVPPGPLEAWHSDPFVPTLRDGKLFGRGAADMKSSLAAMLVATEDFLRSNPQYPGRIAFLITSDEEGIATHGTKHVVETLRARKERIDFCLVGEPSSEENLADVVKNGRRGSLNGNLRVLGVQGHVAYPEKAENPIHRALPALHELVHRQWDAGNADFPATRLQISNIHAGTGASNVIPGDLVVQFNFRFSPVSTVEGLQSAVEEILHRHGLRYELDWQFSGPAFHTAPGRLLDAVQTGITRIMGRPARLSTGGGTSDGRFIAQLGGEVVELGPVNASIHKINEHIALADLERLPQIYLETLRAFFGSTSAQ